MTKKGIYLNIMESTYSYEYKQFEFYFSSKVYRDKFIARIAKMKEEIEGLLYTKVHVKVDVDEISAFKLYEQIEKRGWNVTYKPTGNKITKDEINYKLMLNI